ncbi:TPA: hypothetical protein ACGRQA_001225 [Stenotrophomonas maltophilia]
MRSHLQRRLDVIEKRDLATGALRSTVLVHQRARGVYERDGAVVHQQPGEAEEAFYRRACVAFAADDLIALLPGRKEAANAR